MPRILIGGAGGAPSNNVIRSWRVSGDGDHLIGMCSSASDLMLADVDERQVVPIATAPDYPERLEALIGRTRADLLHVQHDFEVRRISRECWRPSPRIRACARCGASSRNTGPTSGSTAW